MALHGDAASREVLLSAGISIEQIERLSAEKIEELAAMVPESKCCLCGDRFRGWGHNPSPVLEETDAVACGGCNVKIVLRQRFRNMNRALGQ